MEKHLIIEKFNELQNEVKLLKTKNRLLSVAVLVSLCLFFILVFNKTKDEHFDKLTTKSLIVQDNNGNDRIIISPQISVTKSRIRKDTLQGIVVLDEYGHDRLVFGATPTILSNNQVIKRADNDFPYGFVFNDKSGNERGGFGYYANRGLVSFGMDYSNGQEAIAMFVADKTFYGQKSGLTINNVKGGQQLYMGTNVSEETMLNLDVPSKARLSIQLDSTGKSTVTHYDYIRKSSKTFNASQQ